MGREPFLPKVSFHGLVQEVGFQVPVERGSVLQGDPLQPFHGLPEAINSGLYLTPRLGPEQITMENVERLVAVTLSGAGAGCSV